MQSLERLQFMFSELSRQVANLVRWGTVHEVDSPAGRVRIRYAVDEDGNPVLSAWVPWLTTRAGGDRTWWAPDLGEQVILLSPSGDPAQAVALPAVYSQSHPAPSSDPDKHVTLYSDGARIEYDRANHRLEAILPAQAKAKIVASGGVRIEGDTEIDGDLTVTGDGTVKMDLTVEGEGTVKDDLTVEGDVNGDAAVNDRNGSMQEMRGYYNSHAHTPMGVAPQMT